MSDLISRQAAIKELESGKDKKAKGEIGGFYNQIIENDIEKLKKLPSAQPEPKEFEWCHDCKECDQAEHCCHRWTKVIRQTIEEMKDAQPERKEIGYAECADAALKMWIDNVLTDGEYNRIMGNLNKFWGKKEGEKHD